MYIDLFCVLGIVFAIVQTSCFGIKKLESKPFIFVTSVLNCPICVGFWVGLIYFWEYNWRMGFVISFMSFLIKMGIDFVEALIIKLIEDKRSYPPENEEEDNNGYYVPTPHHGIRM